MQPQPSSINDEAFLLCVVERTDAAATVHSWESFKHTMGTAPPKPPGLIGRRRLLALSHAAYEQDDMSAFIDVFSQGLSPLSFTVQRQRLCLDSRIFLRTGFSNFTSVKLFDAAVFDSKLIWACLAVALGISTENDDLVPAFFRPLLLDHPEFIELLLDSDPAALLVPRSGKCFCYTSSDRLDLLGAASLLGATRCVQLLLEKTVKLTADPQWGDQAKVSLKLAIEFARLNYSHQGATAAQKVCTDLSAALEAIQPIASFVPLSTSPSGPDCTQIILERMDSMALRIEQIGARVEMLFDETQALRNATKPLGFDPLRLIGRRRESAPLTSPAKKRG